MFRSLLTCVGQLNSPFVIRTASVWIKGLFVCEWWVSLCVNCKSLCVCVKGFFVCELWVSLCVSAQQSFLAIRTASWLLKSSTAAISTSSSPKSALQSVWILNRQLASQFMCWSLLICIGLFWHVQVTFDITFDIPPKVSSTGWRRPIGCFKLKDILR